jgi:hypothetical protein
MAPPAGRSPFWRRPIRADRAFYVSADIETVQPAALANQGGYYPKTIEAALDRVMSVVQQLKRSVFTMPIGQTAGAIPRARAGKFFGWDADGNPVALSGTGNDAALRTDLAATTGADLISRDGQTVADVLEELGNTPDRFTGSDTQKLQAALNARGLIRLTREYTITDTPTIYGDTQIIGTPGAKLTWAGPVTDSMLQDSSVVTPTDVNLNILLENFEIDGGDLVAGDDEQIGINFFRTGNVTIRGLTVHGVGGSGIRWGNSYADTTGVLVENCTVYDCREGDGIQGSGHQIVIRNNALANFGDTAIALLYDESAVTNPSHLYSRDPEIYGNKITGGWNAARVFTGSGGSAQTGIAAGPFGVDVDANINIHDNVLRGLYVNIRLTVLKNANVHDNYLGAHAATDSANVLIEGVQNLRFVNNDVVVDHASGGDDYSGLLLVAKRFDADDGYGASVFDADVKNFEISDNRLDAAPGITASGVRFSFAEAVTGPSFTSKLTDGVIQGNHFRGFTTRVDFAPVSGAGSDLCDSVLVADNEYDSTTGQFARFAGAAAQYKDTRVERNTGPSNVTILSGVASYAVGLWHKITARVSVPTGAATTILALPTFYGWANVSAKVLGNDEKWSSRFAVSVNESSRRDGTPDNGTFLTLSRSGANVQATQTSGSTVTCYVSAILEG